MVWFSPPWCPYLLAGWLKAALYPNGYEASSDGRPD